MDLAGLLLDQFSDAGLLPLLAIAALLALGTRAVGALSRAARPKFTAKTLLNRTEIRLFRMLDRELPPRLRLFCQVSYGEIVGNRNFGLYMSINAKRADFVVANGAFDPVAVVELQGAGHYGRTARSRADAMRRDRQKRRALLEAGIPLIEVPATFDVELVRQLLAPVLVRPASEERRNG